MTTPHPARAHVALQNARPVLTPAYYRRRALARAAVRLLEVAAFLWAAQLFIVLFWAAFSPL